MSSEYDIQGELVAYVLARTDDADAREALHLLSFLIQEQHELAHAMGNGTIKAPWSRRIGYVKIAKTDHWLRAYPGTNRALQQIEDFLRSHPLKEVP